jgi:Tol biopolymer transport system component
MGGGAGQIAFASDRSGTTQIWVMNVDGSDPRQVNDMPEGSC